MTLKGRPLMSRTDDVVDGIRHMIIDDVLPPGSRLPAEKDLATALGVSRNPLREGVSALSILGVLEVRQGDGTYVTSLAPRCCSPRSASSSVSLIQPAQTPFTGSEGFSRRKPPAWLPGGSTLGLAGAGRALQRGERLIGTAPVTQRAS